MQGLFVYIDQDPYVFSVGIFNHFRQIERSFGTRRVDGNGCGIRKRIFFCTVPAGIELDISNIVFSGKVDGGKRAGSG